MATEKRLIDVNKFKHKMKLEFLDRRTKFISLQDLCECIDDMHTVDAVEVVHGRWIIEHEESIRCSECCFNRAHIKIPMDYCPKCGADMRSDEE